MFTFDLQLFGGGGSKTQTVEMPVYQNSASASSPVQQESATDSTRQKKQAEISKAKGRRYTNTGAGTQGALTGVDTASAAAQIKKLLGE